MQPLPTALRERAPPAVPVSGASGQHVPWQKRAGWVCKAQRLRGGLLSAQGACSKRCVPLGLSWRASPYRCF